LSSAWLVYGVFSCEPAEAPSPYLDRFGYSLLGCNVLVQFNSAQSGIKPAADQSVRGAFA
jgi:hypothetical protein